MRRWMYIFGGFSVLVCQWSARVTWTPCLMAGYLLCCHWILWPVTSPGMAGDIGQIQSTSSHFSFFFITFPPNFTWHLALNSAQGWLPTGPIPWFVTLGAAEMPTPVSAMEGAKAHPQSVFLLPFLSPFLHFFHVGRLEFAARSFLILFPLLQFSWTSQKPCFVLQPQQLFMEGGSRWNLTVLGRSFTAEECSGHRYL